MLTCEELVKKVAKDKFEKDSAIRLAQTDRVKAIEEEYKDELEVISEKLYNSASSNKTLELRNISNYEFEEAPDRDKWFTDYRKQHLDLFPKGQKIDSEVKKKYYVKEFASPLVKNKSLVEKAEKFAEDIGFLLIYYGYSVATRKEHVYMTHNTYHYPYLKVDPPKKAGKIVMTNDLYEILLDIKSLLENKDDDYYDDLS